MTSKSSRRISIGPRRSHCDPSAGFTLPACHGTHGGTVFLDIPRLDRVPPNLRAGKVRVAAIRLGTGPAGAMGVPHDCVASLQSLASVSRSTMRIGRPAAGSTIAPSRPRARRQIRPIGYACRLPGVSPPCRPMRAAPASEREYEPIFARCAPNFRYTSRLASSRAASPPVPLRAHGILDAAAVCRRGAYRMWSTQTGTSGCRPAVNCALAK